MMFQTKITSENNGGIQKVCIFDDKHRLSFGESLELWRGDEVYRDFIISNLKNAPYDTYRWEMPPVTLSSLNRDFEFVIIDSPYLPQSADPTPFGEFFRGQKENDGVVVFPNLGKDAMMIVPTPADNLHAYAHMASFVRQAPDRQVHALFAAVGETMHQLLGEEKIWLNTAGGGVAWLHVRMDSYPKYYQYHAYRENTF